MSFSSRGANVIYGFTGGVGTDAGDWPIRIEDNGPLRAATFLMWALQLDSRLFSQADQEKAQRADIFAYGRLSDLPSGVCLDLIEGRREVGKTTRWIVLTESTEEPFNEDGFADLADALSNANTKQPTAKDSQGPAAAAGSPRTGPNGRGVAIQLYGPDRMRVRRAGRVVDLDRERFLTPSSPSS